MLRAMIAAIFGAVVCAGGYSVYAANRDACSGPFSIRIDRESQSSKLTFSDMEGSCDLSTDACGTRFSRFVKDRPVNQIVIPKLPCRWFE